MGTGMGITCIRQAHVEGTVLKTAGAAMAAMTNPHPDTVLHPGTVPHPDTVPHPLGSTTTTHSLLAADYSAQFTRLPKPKISHLVIVPAAATKADVAKSTRSVLSKKNAEVGV